MKSLTRTETIGNSVYCAYCGKLLHSGDYIISPEPYVGCDCESASEEKDLFNQLRKLYLKPIADSLIEMKVDAYRNKLKGVRIDNSGIYYSAPLQSSPCSNPNDKFCVGNSEPNQINKEN